MTVAGPEQGGAERLANRGAVREHRSGVAQQGGAIERQGGELVSDIGIRGGDADGAASFYGQGRRGRAKDGGADSTAHPTGDHFL